MYWNAIYGVTCCLCALWCAAAIRFDPEVAVGETSNSGKSVGVVTKVDLERVSRGCSGSSCVI